MFIHSLALAASVVIAVPPGVEMGDQLTYAGTMTTVKEDGNPAIKEFQLTLVATGREGEAVEFGWALEETGRGGWLWLDRFGQFTARSGIRDDGSAGPALLYERAEGKSVVPLLPPLFSASTKLEKDAAWSEGGLDYRVAGESKKAGHACWQIDVRSPYGPKRTLWVQQNTALVVAVRETVFIGQGDEHKLQFELAGTKNLSEDETADTQQALAAWLKLRQQIGWQPRTLRVELNDSEISILKAELPKVIESSTVGPFKAIAVAAQKDSQDQKGRAGAVAALRAGIIGKQLGEFKFEEVGGKAVAEEDLKGKVVVLHFWEYRDAPLEEPYGQIGYLDYLKRRHGDAVVIGVNVDPRAADEETRRSAIASARKLKGFMNLSYPIVIDDSTLIKRLGDPRTAGGKLPLFVVVGKDGKIAEYHAGLYEVKANEGLAELDALVRKLLK